MIRNLVQTGNSKALIITKEMREHLGIENEVEVRFRKNSIVIRLPGTDDEAEKKTAKASKKSRKDD